MGKISARHPTGKIPVNMADLRGVNQLVVDAVTGVTNIVKDVHQNIAATTPVVGQAVGISGLVYRSVRGVTRAVGLGIDTALAQFPSLANNGASSSQREILLAVLNGVVGDHLSASNNPLAISMQLRQKGQPLVLDKLALAGAFPNANGKVLVLAHGLCMNDLDWQRDGHDHGQALAQELGYTPLYLHYNTGRHISINGREFAAKLESLLQAWPVPITELVIVCHSMGGLVARSACYAAQIAGHNWLRHLKKLVFLGTPHHGAPLERAGSWVDFLMSISPYSAPIARLGKARSAGVKDLRYGNLVDADWDGPQHPHAHDPRTFVPLPAKAQCFALAATKRAYSGNTAQRLPGDCLVPVKSALGQHDNPARTLPISPSHQRICYGLDHFDLLSSHEVYDQLRRWLSAA